MSPTQLASASCPCGNVRNAATVRPLESVSRLSGTDGTAISSCRSPSMILEWSVLGSKYSCVLPPANGSRSRVELDGKVAFACLKAREAEVQVREILVYYRVGLPSASTSVVYLSHVPSVDRCRRAVAHNTLCRSLISLNCDDAKSPQPMS